MKNQILDVITGCALFTLGLAFVLGGSGIGIPDGSGHALVLILTGILSLCAAFFGPKSGLHLTLLLGLFYGLALFTGIMFDYPGAIEEGFYWRDPTLDYLMPGFFNLEIMDHLFHGIIAVCFLLNAYFWRRPSFRERKSKEAYNEFSGMV